MNTPVRLMLTGGGTGGHLFPAIATAEALCRRLPGSDVLFVGTTRKMDQDSLAEYGYATCSIHCQGLKGKDILSLVQGLAVLPLSCVEAMYHILRFRPHLVLGVGGYVTGPVVAVAKLLGRPTLIHEQNSIPGLANRKLAPLVTRICLSLPGSEKWFPSKKSVLTGNPVRHAILALAGKEKKKKEGPLTLLVLGGSLGAHRVNALVTEAFALGFPGLQGVRVVHQTGPDDAEMVAARYRQNKIEATVSPFFRDMAGVYEQADLLVSRAGATTLAELAVLGKPALLIPYPHAADRHQEKNAEFYVQGGGAVMFVEKELTADLLGEALVRLLADRQGLEAMGTAMRSKAFPEATEHIVDVCMDLLGYESQGVRSVSGKE
jgi:UDP-N-acetylglucosamine--N-acetylmuramyl-(pentapeptide) pyrophosphoryl-undecaprenol N-acetylglucosamine transferase